MECLEIGMSDKVAIEVAKFNARLDELLSFTDKGSDTKISEKDLLIFVREALSSQAVDIVSEKKILEQELVLLRKQMEPLEKIRKECETKG